MAGAAWSLCAAVAIVAATSSGAVAQNYVAGGLQIGSPDTEEDGVSPFARLRYGTEVATRVGEADLGIEATGLVSAGAGQDNVYRTHLFQEAFAIYQTERVTLSVGRQLILWGVADGFNPTDVVTPRNFQLPAHALKDPRFGVDAAVLEVSLSDAATLTTFATYRPSTNLLADGLDPTETLDREKPFRPEGNGFGGQFAWLGELGDLTFSAYRGPARFAVVIPEAAGTVAAAPDITMIGADFDTVVGPWRLYSEVALHQYDGDFATEYLPDDEILAVFGAEFELSGVNRAGAQLFYRNLQTNRPTASGPLAALSEGARRTYGQFDERQVGASLTYFWESEDTLWSGDISVASWFEGDSFVRARGKYRLSDTQAIYLYSDVFGGPDDAPFGVLADTSTFNLEYRHFF
ncbi:MAG: hypothetical protein AAFQ51_03485 [Pseudomonadota bacterium]